MTDSESSNRKIGPTGTDCNWPSVDNAVCRVST
jgi:hypothetical protein